jgi:hypothetical protein
VSAEIRKAAREAKLLKDDPTFKSVVASVREAQISVFMNSEAGDVSAREEAHAMVRALNLIEVNLDAAIAAETLLDHRKRK